MACSTCNQLRTELKTAAKEKDLSKVTHVVVKSVSYAGKKVLGKTLGGSRK